MSTMQELIQDIADRQKAIGDQLAAVPNEESIRALIKESLPDLANDETFVRKMKFAGEGPDLRGTKFARFNFSVADVEFAYEVISSLQGQRRIGGGM